MLAKPEREVPSTGGHNPLKMMLQTLLADRFKPAVHKKTKELPIFELVLARCEPSSCSRRVTTRGDANKATSIRLETRCSIVW